MQRGSLWVAALAAATLVAGCGSDGEPASRPSARLKEPGGLVREGTLSVCADLSFPPMSFEDPRDRQPTGFDIDAARAVAELWGAELAVHNMPFDGTLPALSSGRCDVAWTGINVTPKRLESFGAIPYLKTAEVIIVPKGSADRVTTPESLAGATVATQSGTLYAKRLEKLAGELKKRGVSPPRIQTYPKMTDAIQQLVVGRADAVLTQDTEAAYRSTQQKGAFETAYTYPDAREFGVYFERDSMRRPLTRALQILARDGTLAASAKRYGLSPKQLVTR